MRPVVHIKADRKLYGAALFQDQTVHKRLIFLMDIPVLKVTREPVMGLFGEPQHHQAACGLIKAVDAGLADAGGEERPDAGCHAVLLVLSLALYAEHSRGFVDNHDVAVLIDYVQPYDVRQKRPAP